MTFLDRLSTTIFAFLLFFLFAACKYSDKGVIDYKLDKQPVLQKSTVIVGAQRLGMYHPMLAGKKVAAVVNQTSIVGGSHLIDTLLTLDVQLTKIFAPEHGFRGEADAGEKVNSGVDAKTKLPIVSLYGKNKKPSQEQLAGVDVVLFDIQDVGVRFYTYISTLHYVMEACAEAGITVIVLDRPNPNAHYIDGPILEKEFESFIGMHPVPVVYGMTIGEYAAMINGESWLENGLKADLTVVECKHYTHDTFYDLPVKPSPNLPNARSILLYPSLCFFEGTTVSVGRGTNKQFQVYGHPSFGLSSYAFTPKSMAGAKYPKHEGKVCLGYDLQYATVGSLLERKQLDLTYILNMHKELTKLDERFFNENNFFEKLAGTASLRKQIIAGMSENEIRASWSNGIADFKITRAKYLKYD